LEWEKQRESARDERQPLKESEEEPAKENEEEWEPADGIRPEPETDVAQE
jgi:hypothetical protein